MVRDRAPLTRTPEGSAPRVLLVNPWIHDFAAFNLWVRPLGLLELASFLAAKGCRVTYLDCLHLPPEEAHRYGITLPRVRAYGTGKFHAEEIPKPAVYGFVPRRYRRYGKPPSVVREFLRGRGPFDVIFLTSSMTYWYPGVQETIRVCSDMFPRTPIVLGGTYATLCRAHAEAHAGADAVLPGPWKEALRPLMEERFGISWTAEETSPERLPFPAHDLYPGSTTAVMRLSRGCPFRCAYCAVDLLSPRFSLVTPARALEEVSRHAAAGRRDIAFYDDALLVNPERTLVPFLEGVSARGIACRFHTPNGIHARFLDPSLARLLRKAGFVTIRISFESLRGRARNASDGKVEPADLERAVDALAAAGYERAELEVYILMGLPGQTDAEVKETAEFVHGLGCTIRPAQYSPVPGTALYRASGLDDNADPLLHNSTIAAAWNYEMERYDALKSHVRALNAKLKQR